MHHDTGGTLIILIQCDRIDFKMTDIHQFPLALELKKQEGENGNSLAGVCTNKVLQNWKVKVETKEYHRYDS